MEYLIVIIAITLILSTFFSGAEIAFVRSNKLKIEIDRKSNKLSGRILTHFIKHPSGFVSTVLLGNTLMLVLYGIAMTVMLENPIRQLLSGWLESSFLMSLIQILIAAIILLLFAVYIPNVFFRLNPNRLMKILAFPLYIIYLLFFPLQLFFVRMTGWFLRHIFRMKFTEPVTGLKLVDIDGFLLEHRPDAEEGNEFPPEIQMIQNTMDFRNMKIRDCMIPRNEIIALEINDSIQELRELFISKGHSKILIYKETIDKVIGYVHSYDLFNYPKTIGEILKTILIVPETMPARELLRMFIQSRKHVAVVVDEFGGTSGMLTLEDLLEEIVGEISDEFDKEGHTEKKISDHEFIFSGRLEIDYLNEKYKLKLPEDESYNTLAGLIIQYHENIPAVNECIVIEPFEFTILQASEIRIEQVMMKIAVS